MLSDQSGKVQGVKQYIDFIDYQFLSYDSVKHSLIELCNWIWPSRYELSNQLEESPEKNSYFKMYLSLYKKELLVC